MARILVVEDSRTQAEELRLLLESEGFAVDTAADAHAGLERLHGSRYDLVLSDIVMPGMSGYDLCRAIKANPATGGVPVVLLTQLTSPADILMGLECGAENFITKPFEPSYLTRRLRDILSQTGTATTAHAPLCFRGREVPISANKEQILSLLMSALEEFLHAKTAQDEERRAREAEARRAQELAETGRRKDQHLHVLAHELRGPLAPILNSLQVVRRGGSDSQAGIQALDTMERQLGHLRRLVDDLLDAARLNTGRMRLQSERLDLARLVRVTTEDYKVLLDRAGLSLIVDVPETPLWVKGDPTRLIQVLNNLLDNASKFTGRAGQVTVRLAPDELKRQAVLTVADTGAGMDPATLANLFEAFAQADQGLDRRRGGLGLGLAVVKGLIGLHGGEILAASAGPGRGSELRVTLPLEPEPAALQAGPAPSGCTSGKMRILVVEDNRDTADSMCLFLGLLGHETKAAYTGPEGVKAARQFRPAVVLCDIGLPELDGFGVARALRLLPETAKARLVAVTGYGNDEDRRRSNEAGFDHHFTKPVAPDELQRYLTAVR